MKFIKRIALYDKQFELLLDNCSIMIIMMTMIL
jgi:hypothetical protein